MKKKPKQQNRQNNTTTMTEQLKAATRATDNYDNSDSRIKCWDNYYNCYIPKNGPYTREQY